MPPQLDLHFSTVREGRTVLRSGFSRFPLRHSPEVYLNEAMPHLATCFVTNSSGGIFDEDQLEVRVRLDARSKLRLANLSATLLHKTRQSASRENWRVEMGEEAYCELVRRPLIPTMEAEYEQSCHLDVGRRSIVILADTVFSGRFSAGERHQYKELRLALDVFSCGAQLVSERARIRPMGGIAALRSEAGWNCMGTVYCIGVDQDWAALEQEMTKTLDDPLIGVGCLPNGAGLLARFLCPSSDVASHYTNMVVDQLRSYFAAETAPGEKLNDHCG